MQLVNSSPVPADAFVAEFPGVVDRVGVLTAKATFCFADNACELDTQRPFALLREDEETELGVLPRDISPRRDNVFEVMLLGCAHVRNALPAREQRLRLSVGDRSAEIVVIGDRRWAEGGEPAEPEPFTRMPLTWERAFGGAAEVEIDEGAVIEVADPLNRRGRGFDAATMARSYADALRVPPGYPKCTYDRRLPNLEDPRHRIARPRDAPKPACWAPIPPDVGFHMIRAIEREQREERIDPADALREVFQRAHPDWILPSFDPGARVTLEGMSPDGPVSFALPQLRVIADYIVGPRKGERELLPTTLVLLPEERRFYLVYRATFSVPYEPVLERCFRIRLEGQRADARVGV